MTTLATVEQRQSLSSLIDLYLTSCRIEGKSPETVRSYRESLAIFLHAVGQEGLPQDPASFTTAHVYQFLSHVANTGVSAVTRWRGQRESRTFFSWLLRHDYISANPFAKVKNIKVPHKIIQPFSQDDILRLLACCDLATPKGARDRALILTLLDTGLRAGELPSLQLEDIDFPSQRVHVRHGKGNKQRVVRIGDEAGQALQHYLERFRGFDPGPLFLTCRRRPSAAQPCAPSSSAWANRPPFPRSTLTASATPSPPGPSNSRPARSTFSSSSATRTPTC